MKKTNVLWAALGVVALTACNRSVDVEVDDSVAVNITAGLSSSVSTRASDTNWDADVIGVTVIADTKGTMVTAEYTNVPYATTSTDTRATFEAVHNSILFRANYTGTATFAAYAPYSASVGSDNLISLNTSLYNDTPKNQETYLDYIYATGATATYANPTVVFDGDRAFTHRLIQFNLTLKTIKTDDLTVDISEVENLYLGGIIHEGTFNTLTGEVLATGDVVDNWDIKNLNYVEDAAGSSRTYSFMLLPQNLERAFKLSVTIQGKTYVSQSIKPDMTQNGVAYNYVVSVQGNKGIVVEGSTITDWSVQDSQTDDAYQE